MILLTGATGFLGRHIAAALLEQGYALRLLVRNPDAQDIPFAERVELAAGDLLDPLSLAKAMEGVEYVVHAAAVVSFARRNYAAMRRVNVEGTANVVNAALETGVKRFVYISSNATTGGAGRGETVDENTKWQDSRHNNGYAQSKHEAEMEVHRGVAEGLPAVMLNPGVILGPGDWQKGSPRFFSMMAGGFPFYNTGVKGFVGAQDVAQAVILAMHGPFVNGERFILCAENLSFGELFYKISTALGVQPPRWKVPLWAAWAIGVASEIISALRGTEPILTRDTARSSATRTFFNGSAARRLGLEYTPIDIVIRETAGAFRKEHPVK